jgi:hypothetical protein
MRWITWSLALATIGAAALGCAAAGEPTGRRDAGDAGDASSRPDANDDAGRDGGLRVARICDSCVDDTDCGETMVCVRLSVGGHACLPLCNSDLPDCPRAFNCISDVAAGPDAVCSPVGGPCCVDEDADGYGQGVGCDGRDCDDANDAVNAGTPEACNEIDDDCDGLVDETAPETCDDGADQDCDDLIDCADDDCSAGESCGAFGRACAAGACICPGGTDGPETMCGDARDDDCDGAIDCADTECEGRVCGAEGQQCSGGACVCPGGGTETACGDAIDNDCDGLVDCGDPNCTSMICGTFGRACIGGFCACPLGTSETSCEDAADTDCDGLVDCADPDCATRTCGTRGRVCGGGACRCPGGDIEATCANGTDDDCDGLIDCGDTDCSGDSCGTAGRVCIASACACPSTFERCNGRDDDCDSLVDDGCPRATVLGAAATGTTFGGGGGVAFTSDCPTGRVLIGFDGGAGVGVDRLTPVCAPISLATDTSTSPDYTYRVNTGAAGVITTVGGGGGTAFSDRCPANEIVIGLRGRSGTEIDQFSFQCARLTVARDASLSWVVIVTPTGTSTARGGGGGTPFSYDCPAGRVATGITGRSGTRIDALAARCSSVTFTVF